jgi:diguanylate cyclase (GGDEF)-like protein/putative nucleotidyltransferase with HDIG domain
VAGLAQLTDLVRRERNRTPSGVVPLPLLVSGVGLAGLAVLAGSLVELAGGHRELVELTGSLVLLGAAILAERFPVPLGVGSGGVSLAAVFIVGAGYLYGWAPAIVVGCVTRGVFEVLQQRRRIDRLVYNTATYGLAAGAAGLAAGVAPHDGDSRWLICNVLLASTAFYVTNVVLIAAVIATASRQRVNAVLDETVRTTASLFGIMFTVSLMLDVLWQRAPILSAALLGPLLALALYQRSSTRERAAMELALTDPLTALGNYRAFQRTLDALLDDADENGTPVSLCVLDLDEFKEINDRHGHPAGDRILTVVADSLRSEGQAFRLGGDEFALLLPGVDEDGAFAIGSRAVMRVASGGRDGVPPATMSAGVATYPGEDVERSQLVRAADRALYAAKTSGRNAVRAFARGVIESSERRTAAQADRRARLNAASCLARTIEARDAYTSDHSDAVAELAARLALELGLSPEEAELMRLAGRVHDLGKVAIAEDVLCKPGPLTGDERATIETHSEVGFRMLSSLGIEPVALWVRHHHERWDGTGYPTGLAGEEIPIGARILAVADAYEAMTSDRVYQDGMAGDEALAEIARCAHTQFDPRVVDALFALAGLEPAHHSPAALVRA